MQLTSVSYMTSYTGFDQVGTLLTQSLLVVTGTEADLLLHSQKLYAKAPGPKELVLIEGATHMDFYDGSDAVAAAAKLTPFVQKNLGVEAAG